MRQRKARKQREARAQLDRLSYLELRQEARRVRLQGGRFNGLNRTDSRQLMDEVERDRSTPVPYEPTDWSWIWFPAAALLIIGGWWMIQTMVVP